MFWYHINTRGVSSQGEYKFLKSDNEVLWLNGNFNPIKDQYGIVYKTIFMSTNITEKKLIESEVNKKNGYLEYAAKILRHDMHSGINTYIPRGLNSLFRRLTPENIDMIFEDIDCRSDYIEVLTQVMKYNIDPFSKKNDLLSKEVQGINLDTLKQ